MESLIPLGVGSNLSSIILKHDCAGFGEVIAMEPTIRYWREKGCNVFLEARNPNLSLLASLLGAGYIQTGKVRPSNSILFHLEGRVCLFETLLTLGNRAKGHLLSCGPPPSFLQNGYCKPRMRAGATLPPVSDEVKGEVRDRIFVQLYAGETYKAPPVSWYVEFLNSLSQYGWKGFTVLGDSRFVLNFPVPSDFLVLRESNILKSLSIFREAYAAVVLDSLWLQAAGMLDKPALALCGPYTSPGRVEDFKQVVLFPNYCPHAPCWRTSTKACLISGGACKCLEPPMGMFIPFFIDFMKGVTTGALGKRS